MRRTADSRQGRLRNSAGELVSSEHRASTLAAYLEDVQWAVRPATLTTRSSLGDTLPVCLSQVTVKELCTAARAFKIGRACGPDEQPVKF